MTVNDRGDKLFTGQEDGDIQIWDLPSFSISVEVKAHPKLVTSLMSFGQYLASGSYYDKYVYVWDIQEQKQIGIINCRGPINNIFMNDSNEMIINSDEGIFV
jgi:WD40 repeat protein